MDNSTFLPKDDEDPDFSKRTTPGAVADRAEPVLSITDSVTDKTITTQQASTDSAGGEQGDSIAVTLEPHEPIVLPTVSDSVNLRTYSAATKLNGASPVFLTNGSREERIADLEVQPGAFFGQQHYPRHFLLTFKVRILRKS